jgi:ubiquinone/menaquinone biosynthesis C-methylase UbiE
MRSVREVFAAAAPAYRQGNALLTLERPETESLIGDVRGLRVLDLGSGTGHYAEWVLAHGAQSAVALDLTAEMLEAAPRPAVVGDAARLPFAGGSFDLVVAALVLSFVGDRAGALREAARVLRAGGALVLSDMHEVASDLGWRRSFSGPGGERLELHAPPPRSAAVRRALAEAGFLLSEAREARIDDRLEGEFRRAGRRDFGRMRGLPVLQLYRACREGS